MAGMFYNPNSPPLKFDDSAGLGGVAAASANATAHAAEVGLKEKEMRQKSEEELRYSQAVDDAVRPDGSVDIEQAASNIRQAVSPEKAEMFRHASYANEKDKLDIEHMQTMKTFDYTARAMSFARGGMGKEAAQMLNSVTPDGVPITDIKFDKKTGNYDVSYKDGSVESKNQQNIDFGLVDSKTRLQMEYEWSKLKLDQAKERKITLEDMAVVALNKQLNYDKLIRQGYDPKKIETDPNLRQMAWLENPEKDLLASKIPDKDLAMMKELAATFPAMIEGLKIRNMDDIKGFLGNMKEWANKQNSKKYNPDGSTESKGKTDAELKKQLQEGWKDWSKANPGKTGKDYLEELKKQ